MGYASSLTYSIKLNSQSRAQRLAFWACFGVPLIVLGIIVVAIAGVLWAQISGGIRAIIFIRIITIFWWLKVCLKVMHGSIFLLIQFSML